MIHDAKRPILDDLSIPRLPPPTSSRGHQRCRTTIVHTPPLTPRSTSPSPNRSATFLPFFNSRSSSPTRSIPLTPISDGGDVEGRSEHSQRKQKPAGKAEIIASWFDGASEPVSIGFVASPKKEEEDPFHQLEAEKALFSRSRHSLITTPDITAAQINTMSATSSRFSFFNRRVSSLKKIPDSISTLDIPGSLFPEGRPNEITPSTYKNLQHNAELSLRKLHENCMETTAQLKKVTSEKNVQLDELEAANTRNEHLKAQLLEIASRAADQEKFILSLQADLEQARTRAAAAETIRVIEDYTTLSDHDSHDLDHSRTESLDSSISSVDSSRSIFSGKLAEHSPGTSVGCPTPVMKHACRVVSPMIHVPNSRLAHVQPQTTKVLTMERGCTRCHGMKPHEAWDVLGMLKLENAALKERVNVLECAQDDALDAVLAGLGDIR